MSTSIYVDLPVVGSGNGATGVQGVTGSQGATGLQGVTGAQGIQGQTGTQGYTGVAGATGTQGIQGATGTQGIQGVTGQQGFTGVAGATGVQGIQGATGTQGIQGVTGQQGFTGIQGMTGVQGQTGVKGVTGTVGPTVATLTDASSISWDASLGTAFTVTLGGNRTLANPTNLTAGDWYSIVVTQDGTGSRTLAYGNAYKWVGGVVPVLSTAANAVDILSFYTDGTSLYGSIQRGFA